MRSTSRRGFSLVELLIVIGIIALLISILLPTLARAREQARQIVCANNERQILAAMFMYANDNRGVLPLPFPPPMYPKTFVASPRRCALVQQGDDQGDGLQYRWDSGTIWPYVGSRDLKVRERLFNCPSDNQDQRLFLGSQGLGQAPTFVGGRNFSYTFNEQLWITDDPGSQSTITAVFGYRLSRVKGSEHKILIVEEQIPSRESCPLWEMMVTTNWYYHPLTTTRHTGYANMGMADGHVERLNADDLPPATQLLTIGQGYASPSVKWHYWCDLTRVQ